MFKLPATSPKILNLELLIIILIGLCPLLWFKPGYLAAGHDMSYPLAPINFWLDRLYVWTDRIGSFGSNQTDAINGVLIHGLDAGMSSLGFDIATSQKIAFIFWFTLPGLTMYLLLRSVYPEPGNSVLYVGGSSFYMYNHYLLQAWTIAERTKFSVVAAIPLAVLFTINVLYRGQSGLKNALLLAFTLTILNGGAGIPLWGGFVLVVLLAAIVLFIHSPIPLASRFKTTLSFGLLSVIFIALLNIYWLFPYFSAVKVNFVDRVASTGGVDGAISWSRVISAHTSFINLLSLQGVPDWYDNPNHPFSHIFFTHPVFILLGTLFPVLAFCGLLQSSSKNHLHVTLITALLLIILVSIAFSAGSNGITGQFYEQLLTRVPGFSIFRTPFYKFGMALWFGYSILISLALQHLASRSSGKLILGLYLGALGLYNFPFLTGNFFNWSQEYSTMIKIPDYIFSVIDLLDRTKFATRTILFPNNPSSRYEAYDWHYFSLSTIPSISSRQPVIVGDAVLTEAERLLVDSMYKQIDRTGVSELAAIFGSTVALLRTDFLVSPGNLVPADIVRSNLLRSNGFSPSEKFDRWESYTIPQEPLPRVYSPNSLSFIEGSLSDIYDNYISKPIISTQGFVESDSAHLPILFSDPIVTQFVSEAECINCQSIYPDQVIPGYPLILPDNPLYGLYKLYVNHKKQKITDLPSKVNFLLGSSNKNLSAIGVIYSTTGNLSSISQLAQETVQHFTEISTLVDSMTVQQLESIKNTSFFYLRHFEIKSDELHKYINDTDTQKILAEVKSSAHDLAVKMQSIPDKYPPASRNPVLRFNTSLPGDYQLNMFTTSTFLASQDTVEAKLDNRDIQFVKSTPVGNFTSQVSLDSGVHLLVVTNQNKPTNVANVSVAKLSAPFAQTSCQDIFPANFNINNSYRLAFKYQTQYTMTITSQETIEGVQRILELSPAQVTNSADYISYDYNFRPIPGTTNVSFKACLTGIDPSPTTANLSDISLWEEPGISELYLVSAPQVTSFTSPHIAFVPLNQTKYLVQVTGATGNFILGFNERFDQNWQLRAVESQTALGYFTGNSKYYAATQVTEFQSHDTHLVTDLVFPKSSPLVTNHFQLNGIFNGWLTSATTPTTYLLEYQPQNDLYKTVTISLMAMIVLGIILVIIIYVPKKN